MTKAFIPENIKEKVSAYEVSLFSGEGVKEAERELAAVVNKTPGWVFSPGNEKDGGYLQHVSWINSDPMEGDSLGFSSNLHYRKLCIDMFKSGELFTALSLYKKIKGVMGELKG